MYVDVVTLEEYREKNQSNSLCTNLNKSQYIKNLEKTPYF